MTGFREADGMAAEYNRTVERARAAVKDARDLDWYRHFMAKLIGDVPKVGEALLGSRFYLERSPKPRSGLGANMKNRLAPGVARAQGTSRRRTVKVQPRSTPPLRNEVLVNPDWKPRRPGDSTLL